jgi:5-methylcytosine-specific restriction endonuclease McrA
MPLDRVKKSVPTGRAHNDPGCGSLNTPRKEFSARTKRLALERANGFCEGWISIDPGGCAPPVYVRCNRPLGDTGFDYDHFNPDWFSKDKELSNCQILCFVCHDAKTKRDIKAIAKTKRIIKKRTNGKKSKRGFRSWRKFDGTIVHAKR